MTEKADIPINFTAKKSLYQKFIEIVESEGYSKSEFMREALRNELKNRGVIFEKKIEIDSDKE